MTGRLHPLAPPIGLFLLALATFGPAAAAEPPPGEPVTYRNGQLELAAELLLPEGAAARPVPGAVILQGSGDSDRSNAWARSIALELRDNGLAVLLTDKRGSGLSKGDWRRAGFGDLAGDGLVGARFLAARPEVDGERVGVVGLSQGGWVAPMVAASYPREIAFLVTLSSAAVSFIEQSFFEMANTARQAGHDEAAVAGVVELNRQAGLYLLTRDWDTYETARKAGLETAWSEIARGFPATADDPIWPFLRRAASFDPMLYWALLRQPALVVFGGRDEGDNVPVAESVRRLEFTLDATGHDDHEIVVIEDAGHGLRSPDTGDLHPELLSALRGWLESHVTAPAG